MTDAGRTGPPPEDRKRRPAGTEAAQIGKAAVSNKPYSITIPAESSPIINQRPVTMPPEILTDVPEKMGASQIALSAVCAVTSLDAGRNVYFKVSNPKMVRSVTVASRAKRQDTIDVTEERYWAVKEALEELGCMAILLDGAGIASMGICGGMTAEVYQMLQQEARASLLPIDPVSWLLPSDGGWIVERISSEEIVRETGSKLDTIDVYIHEMCPPDLPLAARFARWRQAGRSLDLYRRLGRRRDRLGGGERLRWLVKGLIPAGIVVVIAGPREVGKSTIMLELGVAVATDAAETTWLGQPIDPGAKKGITVILTGEDTDAVVNMRLERLDPEDEAARIVIYALDSRPLKEIAEEIGRMPDLSLLVVDPARRYIEGDEDGSGNVSDFFATLEAVVQRTGATVIVVHHLTKNSTPSSLQQVRETVRGSGVFLDRPRVVLGCFRRDGVTVVGRLKSNLPPDYEIVSPIHLIRDPATLRHLPAAPAEPASTGRVATGGDLPEKLLDAIRRLRAAGQKVMRTGDNELFAKGLPELDGIGRRKIRTAVDGLIAARVLTAGENGIELAV